MGLVVSRFRVPDPVSILPALRTRTEALLRRSVRLIVEPPYFLVTVAGMNVVVHEHADRREVELGLVSVLRSRDRAKIHEARRVLRSLGGVERAGLRSFTYRFPGGAIPSAAAITEALGGRLVQRHPAWGYLRSGLRTPVEIEIHDGGFELQAPIFILGQLYPRALDAARELAQPVPLGASHPPAV